MVIQMNNNQLSILILDDDTAVRESLSDFFGDHEWEVVKAVTGEEAIEKLTERNFDAALVDIRLPGIDGIEFIKRSGKIQKNLACIIVTGSTELLDMKIPIFYKPIRDLNALETAVRNEIEACKNRKTTND